MRVPSSAHSRPGLLAVRGSEGVEGSRTRLLGSPGRAICPAAGSCVGAMLVAFPLEHVIHHVDAGPTGRAQGAMAEPEET